MADAEPLSSRRILIIATDGFEQSELEVPLERLQDAGAEVDIASIEMGDITGWDEDDWGGEIEVDLSSAILLRLENRWRRSATRLGC